MKSKWQLTNTTSSMGADNKKNRLVVGIIFLMYLIVLFYFLFFAETMGRTDADRAYRYNLAPFREITRFIKYRETLGTYALLLNIVGNVLAFVPFGAFLPVVAPKCNKFWLTALYSLELSLLAELWQLVFRVGCFDVDDLMLNTLGGMLGFGLYACVMWMGRKRL